MGFPVPISSWMKKGKVRDYVADTLLSKNCTERGIYNVKSVEKMLINQGVKCRTQLMQHPGALCDWIKGKD